MTYFIFAGDMLVMAFMTGLVVWVSLKSSKQLLDESAAIPLNDEVLLKPSPAPEDEEAPGG